MSKVISQARMEDRLALRSLMIDLEKKYPGFKSYRLKFNFYHMMSSDKCKLANKIFAISKDNLDNMFNIVNEVARQLEDGTYRDTGKKRLLFSPSGYLGKKDAVGDTPATHRKSVMPTFSPNEPIKDYVRRCLLSRPDDIEIVKLWLKVLSE